MAVNPDATCTINEGAKLANVSRRTIYHWLAAGHLEAIRTAGGQQRLDVATLLHYADYLQRRKGARR